MRTIVVGRLWFFKEEKIKMAAFSWWRTWLGVFFFGLFFFGLYIFLTDIEENQCEMTYMYENPEYIKQQLPESLTKKYPKYNLYLYGEGRYAEDVNKNQFSGVPVLFVPGSGGSHRQVRSLASVALRMAYSQKRSFHFNFFSIDFNRELGAVYGGVLWDQTMFLKECILHIKDLYQQKGLNRSLILLGHSMGGVTARAIFLLPNFDSNLVSLIITKAAPHKQPVLSADSHVTNFYSEVRNFWNRSQNVPNVPPMISIGGGERDILVRSDLTVLKEPTHTNISILTTSMPGVWLSTDHLCILWCKQLVMALSRCLFDLVDKNTLMITTDENHFKDVANFYLIQRERGRHYVRTNYLIPVTFSQTGEWILKEERSWRFSRNKIMQAIYILVPLYKDEVLVVQGMGIEKLNWIFGCKLSEVSKICHEGENLSNHAKLTPTFATSKAENRLFRIYSKDLISKGHSHLLVHLVPSEKISIFGERYKSQSRHKLINLPSLFRSLVSLSPLKMLTSTLMEGAVYHNISLKGLTEVWQYYSFNMETRICKHGVLGDGFVRLHLPWNNEDRYFQIKSSLNSVTTVKGSLYQARPLKHNGYAQLQIVLNPDCSYVMYVTVPIGQLVSQFLRFFNFTIPAYITAILLGILCAQLYHLSVHGIVPCVLQGRQIFPSFALLVIIPELLSWAFRNFYRFVPFIPEPDDIQLHQQRQYFMLLRPIGYLISFGIVVSLSLVTQAFLIISGRILMWARSGEKAPMLPNPKQSTPASLCTFLLCCALTLIGVCFCGALAMVITLFIQLIRLISMCGYNRLEEDRRGLAASSTRWHFHHCIFLLQLMSTTVMTPSLVVWFQDVMNSIHLGNDPHLVPTIVTIMAHASMWQPSVPIKSTYRHRIIVVILATIAVLASMYALTTTWRLTHFVATSFAFVAAHQVACRGKENSKLD